MFLEKLCCAHYRQKIKYYLTLRNSPHLDFSLQHCEFRMRGHYHCLRPGCYFVTNITTKLPWHVKKHEKAERRAANGFKYFTKKEECGRLGKLSEIIFVILVSVFFPCYLSSLLCCICPLFRTLSLNL